MWWSYNASYINNGWEIISKQIIKFETFCISEFFLDLYKKNMQKKIKIFFQGSITYLGLKGVLKLYYKQRQYLRQAFRQIKSFEGSSGDTIRAAASIRAPIQPNSLSCNNQNIRLQEVQTPSTSSSSSYSNSYSAAADTSADLPSLRD
jgi:hypothetical protein